MHGCYIDPRPSRIVAISRRIGHNVCIVSQRQASSPRRTSWPVGAEIRAIRDNCGFSQEQLASLLGYSVKQVIRWERGVSLPRAIVLDAIRKLPTSNSPVREESAASDFTFVDLFAGIGGLRKGFESVGGKCVFTSEWDKYCQRTYRANFPSDHPIAGDIIAIPSEAIPSHDVLLAGFPCQPFSLAGVSKKNSLGRPHGFDCNTQGTLFFEIERIIRFHRPKAFLLENVKHLLRHDGGRTWRVILQVLTTTLGYHVQFKVLDAASVLPQHRERVFIVGFRDSVQFSWDDVRLPQVSDGPRLRSILHPEDGSEPQDEAYLEKSGAVRDKYTLTSHLWSYLREYAAKHQARGNGFGYSVAGPDGIARTLSARYHKDGSEILVRRGRGNPRRLTPRECARLMGFDPLLGSDLAKQPRFVIPVSDTQAYRQFGNSVAVPVVCAVARAMAPSIRGQHVHPQRTTKQLELSLAS
jgi:DNA (cytosine-5)-methyltransferase 1